MILIQQELDGALTSYSYDASDQLTSEGRSGSNAYARSYSYDAVGNRLSQNAGGALTSSSYDAANQLLTSQRGASVTSYSYDGAGNRSLENANGAVTSFTWNEESKLVGLSLPSGETQSLVYSGEGDLRRRTVVVDGVTQSDVRLLKDGLVVLQEQEAATGAVLRRYTNGGGEWGNLISLAQGDAGIFNQSLFNVARFNQTRASRFLVSDQLGSMRLLLDATGAITDTSLPSGFGEQLAASGSSLNPFGFGGNWQYLMLVTNLMLAGERVYDAETGTWMSLDSIGFNSGDFNLLRYVGNNPANFIDPSGLQTTTPTPQPIPTPSPMRGCCPANDPIFAEKDRACGQPRSCVENMRRNRAFTLRVGRNDPTLCAEIFHRINNALACYAARVAVTNKCFGGIQNQAHHGQEVQVLASIATCAMLARRERCQGPLPRVPVPVPVPTTNFSVI